MILLFACYCQAKVRIRISNTLSPPRSVFWRCQWRIERWRLYPSSSSSSSSSPQEPAMASSTSPRGTQVGWALAFVVCRHTSGCAILLKMSLFLVESSHDLSLLSFFFLSLTDIPFVLVFLFDCHLYPSQTLFSLLSNATIILPLVFSHLRLLALVLPLAVKYMVLLISPNNSLNS